jgi:hypothetical protein
LDKLNESPSGSDSQEFSNTVLKLAKSVAQDFLDPPLLNYVVAYSQYKKNSTGNPWGHVSKWLYRDTPNAKNHLILGMVTIYGKVTVCKIWYKVLLG